ncbi:DUF3515 domain-containing protein [Agromyces mediolanus]|uniref:DUF3515 domain-containing protein n=1 Tax=Agromyces mediolanus TaxID=41986 RepID=A0A918FCY4_AGRME|nr:DUF3515 domain-containing protein [Agromyces mediolanus]GGR23557.1 hypothetical protein GCM10010196_16700 [Agromyces mediolanus]GLJ71072.1 hypothetical protein GCM10017583_03270 [Agromyces mediolanus]
MSLRSARLRRALRAAAVTAPAALLLAACAPIVPFDPAPEASDADCASLVVRLPDTVAELPKRETNAQGTGAWGEPASVLLRCGVPVPGPTTDRCVSVDGIDWIIDESDAPRYLFTTYGRTPAVEVLVDNDVVGGTTAIADLSNAVGVIPADGGCTSVDDLSEVPSEG